jgi:cob(I)alamin adenosyltransferase
VRIYTKKGDDGTTGLLFGGRVKKSSARIEVNGEIDEAQAMIGLARAQASPDSKLDQILIELARDLYCVMAEVATARRNRGKLVPGKTKVTAEMIDSLEVHIDTLTELFDMPAEFVIPGQNQTSAALDVARTVVRRAERRYGKGLFDDGNGTFDASDEQTADTPDGSLVGAYLNRLSDLLWTMARWQEGEHHILAKNNLEQTAK